MRRLTVLFSSLFLLFACVADKDQRKGEIDDSTPPENPEASPMGKADDASRVIAINVESTHPYENDMNEEYVIELGAVVPSCASRVRLHFASLQLEAGYDFIRIVNAFGEIIESGTGNHDGETSEWLELGATARSVSVVLESDYSIVRHGFRIDGVEWEGAPLCPAFVPTCPDGEVDINTAPDACECPAVPTCVPLDDVEASHATGGGFAGTFAGHRLEGSTAYAFTDSVTTTSEETLLGTIDEDALTAFFRDAARSGVLAGPSVSEPDNWSESLQLRAGTIESTYARPVGTYPESEAAIISGLESLFECGPGRPLTCDASLACVDGSCEAACVCPEVLEPVCGADGVTYDNACNADCAGAVVRHPGTCGIAGDICSADLACQPDNKCRYGTGQFDPPSPAATGTCVVATYCDAPPDCAGLFHPTIPGRWECQQNQCSWEAGSPWMPIVGWSAESAHPYANDASVWTQLYAPAGAASVRIEVGSDFSLEDGYDFLDVWSWNGTDWFRSARFTGTEAAGGSYELGGRYHYVHFASDYSVGAHGFSLTASYSFNEI